MQVRDRVSELALPLRSRAYRRIWAAELASEIGDYAARVALAVLVFDRTDSAAWATATVALSFLPWVGPGQVLSTLADRFGRRIVMVVCDLVRAFVYLALCLPLDLGLLLALTFVASLAAPPFAAARAAAMPEVVPVEHLGPAMKLGGLAQDLGMVLGNMLGAVLLLLGPQLALATNAGTFLLSALLLAGLPALRPAAGPASDGASTPGAFDRLRDGARFLLRDPHLRRAALLANIALGSATAIGSLAVPHSVREFPDLTWLAGAIMAAIAALSLLVTVLVRTDGGPDLLLRRTALLTALPAAIAAPLLLAPVPVLPVLGFVTLGLVLVAITPANTLISPRLPAGVRASAFSVLMGGLAAVQAALTFLAGLLADLTSPHVSAAAVCLVPIVTGAWVLTVTRTAPVSRHRAPTATGGAHRRVVTDLTRAERARTRAN